MNVGNLEYILRQYDEGTEIFSTCNCCNHSSNVSLTVKDRTNQTYGYIELVVNNGGQGEVKLNPDEKEYYEKELNKANETIAKLEKKLKIYEESIENISDVKRRIEKQIRWTGL